MDAAIWAILYDLGQDHRDEYLDWFHDVHIPEKLARPGYLSAGHYEVVDAEGRPVSVLGAEGSKGTAGYIALFGGLDTAVFLNPSPAQIKPKQTELTRTMMGYRSNPASFIATREWLFTPDGGLEELQSGALLLNWCDVPGQDEDYGAWCVQNLRPALSAEGGFGSLAKYLTTVGAMKHATVATFQSTNAAYAARELGYDCEWGSRIKGAQIASTGSPLVARRIWPAN